MVLPLVPTIDLTRVSPDELRGACETVGFFTVVGHGVPDELVEEVAARSRAFFDLPDAEKERFRAPAETPGLPVYRPLGAEKLGANADRKASLDWGPGLAGVAWPSAELQSVYERYYTELLRVAAAIVSAFELGIDDLFDDRSSSLRVIDYPAGATGTRAGAHRDYGALTLIRSDAPGLEVQTRDGEWLPVQAPPGGFVVNIGDLLQRWTQDRWVSTLHRVVGGEEQPPRRQSLVFFHNPRSDAEIDGVRAGEYILQRAAEAGLS
ncbi:MAG TPA: 2-oxoglutarate and iron-dependent oxygenase domain-containing protein [Gaiellaceae bacterium]